MMGRHNCGYFLNNWISYGIFVLLSITFLVSFTLYYLWLYKGKTRLSNFGAILLTSGGLFNLSERVNNGGCVYDYLNFFNLFVFNVYDLMVNLGVIMIIISLYRNNNDERNKEDI